MYSKACAIVVEVIAIATTIAVSIRLTCAQASSTGTEVLHKNAMMTSGGDGHPSLTFSRKRLMKSQVATFEQTDKLKASTSWFKATNNEDRKLRMRREK